MSCTEHTCKYYTRLNTLTVWVLCIRRHDDSCGEEKQRFEEGEEEGEEGQEQEQEQEEEKEGTVTTRIMGLLMLMGRVRRRRRRRRRRTAVHSDLQYVDRDTREREVPVSFPFASKVNSTTLILLFYYY